MSTISSEGIPSRKSFVSYIFYATRCILIGISVLHNTLRPRQNGRRFADDTFKRIFLNENVRISIKISLKFVPKGPINNNPASSEPLMVSLLTHVCVTRPQ